MPTIEPFAEVDVSWMAAWLSMIPLCEWPAMADPSWHGAHEVLSPVVALLMERFPGCVPSGPGLFLLAPGQVHPAHIDEQPPDWVTRVHVPIVTNPQAVAITADGEIHMQAGKAYRFDTRRAHAVKNLGPTARVHLVFDVRSV